MYPVRRNGVDDDSPRKFTIAFAMSTTVFYRAIPALVAITADFRMAGGRAGKSIAAKGTVGLC